MDFRKQVVPYGLLAVVYFTAVFFGGAHVWSQSVLILFICAACATGLLTRVAAGIRFGEPFSIIADPPSLVGILFLVWTAFQLLPLSPEFLRLLSPKTLTLWKTTGIAGGTPPFPLSLYPYMTERSLVFAASVLFFYWWALYGLAERRRMRAVITGLIVLGGVEAFYGMAQLVTGTPYVLWWKKTFSETVATGTFIDRNHFAGFLSMLICLTVGYIWAMTHDTQPHRRRRLYDSFRSWGGSLGTRGIVLVLTVVLMTAALLTSASRGGTLSLLAGLIFMFGLVALRFLKTGKAAVFAAAVLSGLIYTGYIASERVLERFRNFSVDLDWRLTLARSTLTMGRDFPNTGAGLGTFEFVFPRYQDININSLVDYAHNDWVQLFAESGWPGLLILGGGFIWFMAACIGKWRRRRDPFSVGVGLGGLGAFVAIALHSLSEFNLHMPVNALLLALIAALTLNALHSGQREEGEHAHRMPSFDVPRPGIFLLTLLLLWAAGAMALLTFRSWRADALARTVWNSTISAAVPTDKELAAAWKLAPGNATYWNLMAARIAHRMTPALQREMKPGERDADIRFLKEGVRRNPTSWAAWRNLGWSAFLKAVPDPGRYVPLFRYAFERARALRPYAASVHFEYGVAGLLAESLLPGKGEFAWKEAFRTALTLDPELAASVADQLTLYHGGLGAKILRELLPADTAVYRSAADYLLGQGFSAEGFELLWEEERQRDAQAAAFWREYRKQKGRTTGITPAMPEEAGNDPLLKRLIVTAPRHPGALLAQGRILDALRNQDMTGRKFGELGDTAEIAANLNGTEQQQGSPGDREYFLGRIAEERGDTAEAVEKFRKSIVINPNHFPALIRLQALVVSGGGGASRPGDERIAERIRLYAMTEIRPDLWRWTGLDRGWPSWTAPFRIARGATAVVIHFSGDGKTVTKLTLDDRLLDAWDDVRRDVRKNVAITPGKHVLRISEHRPYQLPIAKILPFAMHVEFVFN